MKDVKFEIVVIDGKFEKLIVYVVVHGHRVNEAFIYPTETGYELYNTGGYKTDVLTFTKLKEAFCFASGMAFANERSGYLFESDWRCAEMIAKMKSIKRHKSKSH